MVPTPQEPAPSLVLLVDDEPSVLAALTRLLRPDGIQVVTAGSGEDALRSLEENAASIGVLISDYAMPGMTGAELLRAARLRWPDITRVLLTGNADLPAAAHAVNEGQLSRLLVKPWQPDELRRAVSDAMRQYQLLHENQRLRALADEQAVRLEKWNQRLEAQVAERTGELERANASLRQGALETLRLLVMLLERRLPERAAHSKEIARLSGRLAERAGMSSEDMRRVQVAGLIHDIGLVGLPEALVRRPVHELLPAARAQYQRHAAIGQSMLSTVGQFADIAAWIRHHHERWDGNGYPDRLEALAIPLGSRIIAVASGYVEAVASGGGTASTWRYNQHDGGAFDPDLLVALDEELKFRAQMRTLRRVTALEVQPGTILHSAIRAATGEVLIEPGETLTRDDVEQVRRLAADGQLAAEPITYQVHET
jgi:response regulator RpfG family c-di-GMP phosphodiesterase